MKVLAIDSLHDTLRTVFGFDALRPVQAPILDAVLAGRNVLAVLPTGGGKSLCYQLPGVHRGGLVVVVSPLLALMREQVTALRAMGVPAASLTSSNDWPQNRRVTDALRRANCACSIWRPNAWRGKTRSTFWSRRSPGCWRWTRPIASWNGATISARSIGRSRA